MLAASLLMDTAVTPATGMYSFILTIAHSRLRALKYSQQCTLKRKLNPPHGSPLLLYPGMPSHEEKPPQTMSQMGGLSMHKAPPAREGNNTTDLDWKGPHMLAASCFSGLLANLRQLHYLGVLLMARHAPCILFTTRCLSTLLLQGLWLHTVRKSNWFLAGTRWRWEVLKQSRLADHPPSAASGRSHDTCRDVIWHNVPELNIWHGWRPWGSPGQPCNDSKFWRVQTDSGSRE